MSQVDQATLDQINEMFEAVDISGDGILDMDDVKDRTPGYGDTRTIKVK